MIQKLTFAMLLVWAAFSLQAQAPTLTNFSPSAGATGALITITGTNFIGATAVTFGGTAASSFNVVSATSIQAIVASGSSGNVMVTTTGGSASLAGFTYCLSPTIAITVAPNDSICAGTSVTFTAVAPNPGTSPFYQWKKNNISVGTNSATYTDVALVDNDVITCSLTSTSTCITPVTVTSNVINMTVFPHPTLTSSLTPPNICSGSVFNYPPSSNVLGATFSWSRSVVAGISNLSNIGSGNPNETLTDTTAAPVNVTYVFTILANGCNSINPYSVVVRVNPLPKLTSTLMPPAICSGMVFSYTPMSGTSSVTYNWSRALVTGISNPATTGTLNPNETLTNTTSAPINVTYVYTLSANGCSNPTTFSVVVSVKPLPTLSSTLAPSAICSGTAFSYTPMSATANTTFSWSRALVTGISNVAATGTLNPNEILTNTSAAPVNVTYVYTLSANSCTNPTAYSVVVTVNPRPTLSSTTSPTAVCSGTSFTYTPLSATTGATFSWTRAVVNGINNAVGSGNGVVNETLVNNSIGALNVVYLYTIAANGCTNPVNANVTVAINPLPTLSSTGNPSAICSHSIFSYTPSSATTGTFFSWSRSVVSGISNSPASGTSNPNETLINTGSGVVNVTYVYSLLANSCSNPTTFNVVVPVNPRPTLSSTANPPAVCSRSLFSYTPTSATTGTTFSWNRGSVTGISNVPASGSGNPNETLISTASAPVNVTYVYTLSVNGCTNPNTFSVIVTVNPLPPLTSTLAPPAICSGTLFVYNPMSNVANTNFAWSRAAVTGISATAATATGSPDESLRNTTSDPINVTYVYSLSANGCTNPTTYNVVVRVNPRPTMTSTRTPDSVCSGTAFRYTPVGPVIGTQFSWRRPAVEGITNAAASGTGDPNERLINNASFPVDVTYEYSLSANGCISPVLERVIVTVNPQPRLDSPLATEPFCSGTLFRYQSSTATENARVTWSRAARVGVSNAAATGVDSIRETLINITPNVINVKYAYSLTANGCTSNVDTIVATVLPIPRLSSSLTPDPICSGDFFDYLPTSQTFGTSFRWVRDAVSGISNPPNVGEGSPDEFLKNITSQPVNVVYQYALDANGCRNSRPANVVVTVNPPLLLSSTLTPPTICTGTVFSYTPTSATEGASFEWTREAIPGVTNIASRGTGSIGEVLVNSTNRPISVIYVYLIKANNCISDSLKVIVKIAPLPNLSSSLTPTAVCSGTPFSYVPTSLSEGATFSWSRDTIRGISNAAAMGTGNPNETLINTTGNPITVVYVYSVSSNGCNNPETFRVRVTVNPLPTLTGSLVIPAVCSGSAVQYTPPNPLTNGVYAWSRATVTGISNAVSTGTGAINEVLTNTTTAPVTVTYAYTLSLNSCVNPTPYNLSVVVNPQPSLSSTLSAGAICTGTAFTYTPTSATASAAFSWSRAAVTGITNLASTGISSINESLVNTTSGPINATYVFSVSANGCSSATPFNVVVTVNAKPSLTITNPTPRCVPLADIKSDKVTAGSAAGLTFSYWLDSAATQILSVPQAIGAGKYYIKGTAGSGCFDVKPVTVTVNPTPDVLAGSKSICNGGGTEITVLNPNQIAGATFEWAATYDRNVSGGSGGAKGVSFGLASINENLSTKKRYQTRAYYTITPVGPAPTGCTSTSVRITITIAGKKTSCPAATPSATTETIAHNSSPKTRVDVTNPNGNSYLVFAISNSGGVKGITPAPYTRVDTATIDPGILKNNSKVNAVVTYTIVPYSYGPNKTDNGGGKDDIIGASFTVVVTVTPAPGIIDTDEGTSVHSVTGFLPKKANNNKPVGDLLQEEVTSKSVADAENESNLPLRALNDYLIANPGAMEKPQFELLQNIPNPFQSFTKIGFYLGEPTEAVITIRDLKGSILYRLKANYDQGWNQLDINAGELSASGILFYTLETPRFSETKKMVVLNR
jgi:hypothetical protein